MIRYMDRTENEWKEQPMPKDNLWMTLTKAGQLLLEHSWTNYTKVWLLGYNIYKYDGCLKEFSTVL